MPSVAEYRPVTYVWFAAHCSQNNKAVSNDGFGLKLAIRSICHFTLDTSVLNRRQLPSPTKQRQVRFIKIIDDDFTDGLGTTGRRTDCVIQVNLLDAQP